VRIYEPEIATRSVAANQLTETKESKVESANVRYRWKEIGKWKCEVVAWLAWDNFNVNSSPLVAAGCADGTVKVFDQVGCYCTHNLRGHTAPVTLVKFDYNEGKNSYTLFSASTDCTVRVWSLTESKQVALLKNHMSAVTDIDFINHEPSGARKLVTVGRDQIISIYHMSKGFPLYTTIPVYENLESCIVLTPSMGRHPLIEGTKIDPESTNILVAGESGCLKIWNSKTAKCVFEQPKSNAKRGVDYLLHVPVTGKTKSKSLLKQKKQAADGDESMDVDHKEKEEEEFDMIVAVTNDQNMIVHRTATLEVGDTIVGYNDEIIDAVFVSPTEVAVATNSTDLRVFSLPSFSSKTFGVNDSSSESIQHKEPIMALALSPCKQFIVTASKDATLIVWSVISGKALAQLTGHTQSISTVQFFNRSSRYIVSGGRDLTWKIWDIQWVIDKGHQRSGIDRVSGSILTVKSHNKDVNCVAVAPNDLLLATGSQDKDIKLFSIDKVGSRSVKEFGVLKGHRRGVWDVVFSPVDQVLASCSADMTVKLWNLRDFTCIKTFEGHTASSLKVRFISNGLQLLSSGADGLVKLWNIHDNECVNTFDKHEDKIWGLAVDPQSDGARFVTGGGDSMLCLWKDNTDSEIEAEAIQRDEMVQLEQSLSNYVRDKNYRKALKLSLKLDKPFQALNVIEMAMSDLSKADENLRIMVGTLDFDLTQKLLTYIRDWNTNAKHSHAAQATLFQLFHTYKADSMTKFPLMKDLLQALIPYSTRHFQRLDKLMQASYILDYTLQAMNLLPDIAPVEEVANGEVGVEEQAQEESQQTNGMETDGPLAAEPAQSSSSHNKEKKTKHKPSKVQIEDEPEVEESSKKRKKRKRSSSKAEVE
jgi:U3 small nucleolar RNA-associated protein 13